MHRLTSAQALKLIEMVKENPCLYDKSADEFKRTETKQVIWCKIGRAIGVNDADVCRAAWRSIRDQFIKSHRDQTHGSHAEKSKRKYKYYNELQFLVSNEEDRKRKKRSVEKYYEDTRSSFKAIKNDDSYENFEVYDFESTNLEECRDETEEATLELSQTEPLSPALSNFSDQNETSAVKSSCYKRKVSQAIDPFLGSIGEFFEKVPEDLKLFFKMDVLNYTYEQFKRIKKA